MRAGAVVPVAETVRNGVVESVHHGAIVALATDGTVAWSAGDHDVDVYPRSALKPLQAQAMLDAGLLVDDDVLAVACASHNGEPEHLDAVRRILDGVGLDERALQTTPDLPLSVMAARDIIAAGGGPAPLTHNCSGKHAAMLATTRINGWSTADYLDGEHPVQQVIDRSLADATGGVVHTGIDGCGAPTAVVSLVGLARGTRALAMAAGVVHRAMTARPDLVGGTGRDVTTLMKAVDGLLAKDGAEGVYVAAHPDGRAVALKIADGADRARLPVMLYALGVLGFDVGDMTLPPILGHGEPVGEVRCLLA